MENMGIVFPKNARNSMLLDNALNTENIIIFL